MKVLNSKLEFYAYYSYIDIYECKINIYDKQNENGTFNIARFL